ncbi:enoyl-CoA hydratase/isomerase family protein [Dactylosporangium aurantiacum]|uniref:Enoyl-CoA hydratase/isomerase family protein n=1 Tax=Dactylosporangium aurantiacum TaxID=35754 RepID=A0A9Q9ING7_9ACTN|nr:enoyl-CoA hydratase/isomerase family protein [Dactylosporangium aurantiacum]MDG6106267.1 enoyl-CoA hydratase/isomerase family protein [Dactylosporangium aurantiacum]UWZ58233.1 enoyl-CoA hydratase/isomerase family protein [Dactylosporangium aurantiacum]
MTLTRRGAAVWARIDRPGAGNACSAAVMAGLEEWLAAAADPGVRVLVLTGTGRSFCAGADLNEATALLGDLPALLSWLDRGRRLVRAVMSAGVPTIAAVNGAAFGGGLELLLACDVAVAADTARIGDGHLAAGQVPGWGSSVLLPLAVGPALARRLLVAGETWTGTDAARRGLVSEAVPAADLDRHVDALAERIAALDEAAVRRTLRVARPVIAADAWDREWRTLSEHIAALATGSE